MFVHVLNEFAYTTVRRHVALDTVIPPEHPEYAQALSTLAREGRYWWFDETAAGAAPHLAMSYLVPSNDADAPPPAVTHVCQSCGETFTAARADQLLAQDGCTGCESFRIVPKR